MFVVFLRLSILLQNLYDLTIEDPSDYLQYVHSSVDCLRLLTFDPIKPVLCAMVSSLKESSLSKRTQFEDGSTSRPDRDCPAEAKDKQETVPTMLGNSDLSKSSLKRDYKSIANFRACRYDHIKGEIPGGATGTNGKRLVQMPSSFKE
jgi:histone acetyltransferase 1